MPVGDAILIETLPSATPGVRRMLLRTDGGAIVEALELEADRLASLPTAGIFAPLQPLGGRVVLGPPLQRRVAELRPPPLVVLGLVQRVLEDLEVLHREGGAHGALGLDGVGIDDTGAVRVRPVFQVAQEHTQAGDVRAVGTILLALADEARLVAAGIVRAPYFLSGLGVGAVRPGFGDARAARQALLVITRGLKVEEARDSFLAALGAHLPPAPRQFRVRPVATASVPTRDARMNEARAWLDKSLGEVRSARFEREGHLADEAARITESLHRQTEVTILAARAVAEREAENLAAHTVTPPPAMFFVGAGVRPALPGTRPVPAAEEVEETLDAASADGAALNALGAGALIEAFSAPDGGDSRAESEAVEPAPNGTPAADHGPAGAEILEADFAAAALAAREAGLREEEARSAAEAEQRAGEEARIAAEAQPDAEAARIVQETQAAVEAEQRAAEEARIAAEESARAAAEEVREAERRADEARIAAEESARAAAEEVREAQAAAESARIAEELRIAVEESARAARTEEEALAAAEEAARVAEEARAATEAAEAQAEAETMAAAAAAEARAAAEAAEAEQRAMEAEAHAAREAAAEAAAAEAAAAEAAAAMAVAAEAEAARAEAEAERRAQAEAEAEAAALRAAAAESAAAEAAAAMAVAAEAEAARAVREAERRAAADRAAAEHTTTRHQAAAPPPPDDDPPEDWPAHADDLGEDHDRPGVARWEGLGGVTGNPARMNEKGPGKWTSQGRSREELAEQLPPGESRPIDLSEPPANGGGKLPLFLIVAVVVVLVIVYALS